MRIIEFLKRRKVPALIALALVVVGGYVVLGKGDSSAATLAVTRTNVPIEVSVAGSVTAASSADLGFSASGRIQGTYARVGARVGAGAVLAEIENGDQVASVAQKQAALREAEAILASLERGTRPEELATAEAALVAAIRSAYVAADDAVHNRADALFTHPESSPQFVYAHFAGLKDTLESERRALNPLFADWQASLPSLTNATAASAAVKAQANLALIETFLDNANLGLSQALPDQATSATLAADASLLATGRTNVANAAAALAAAAGEAALKQAGSTSEDISGQRASVAAAAADVANARAALGKTLVVAPFAGVVTRMDAKAGEIVSPGTSEISMQSAGLYQIEVFVPEVSIAGVTPGNSATTTLDAYGPSIPFAASVIAVDPAETMKNGVPTYKTTLIFTGADPRIRSGMTANVVITTGTLPDAIVIPEGAVGHDAPGTFVTVLTGKKHKTREYRQVTTGSHPALGRVEITSGLSEGEVIALAP